MMTLFLNERFEGRVQQELPLPAYSSLPTRWLPRRTGCSVGEDRQSHARNPAFIAANRPSVTRLPQAAPNQPNLGIKTTFRQRLATAAVSCELVRYFCKPAPVSALPAI